MRPQVLTQDGVGTIPTIVERIGQPTNIAFYCEVESGAPTYSVQHSYDDVGSIGEAAATWIDHATVVGETTSQEGNYDFPPRWIRLNITAVTGSGVVKMTVIQSSYGQ